MNYFSESHGTSQQRDISVTIDFFIWLIEHKLFLFEHRVDIHNEPAMTFSGWLFLSQFKRYKLKFVPQIGSRFKAVVLYLKRFLKNLSCAIFSDIFFDVTHEPLNISKISLSHMKERHKAYPRHFRFDLKNKYYMVQI